MPDAAIDSSQANVSATVTPEPTQSIPNPTKLQEPQQASAAPAATPMQPSVNPAAVAHVSRLAQLGHVASALLGKQYDYQVDPQSGKTVQVERPQKPGDLFRHLVAGAILGGAAGAEANQGFGAGVVRGGQAEIANAQQQDMLRRKQAADQFELQNKAKAENREEMLAQAQIAHMHIQDLHADAQMDLMQQEHIDTQNKLNDTMAETAMEKGVPAKVIVGGVDINKVQGNGRAFAKAYSENPRAFDPPDGYYRIHTQTVDHTGLTYKAGTGWVDSDGKSVDMSARTTHHFYDIPKNSLNEPIQKTGKELNEIAGFKAFPDDDTPHSLTMGQLIGLKAQGTKNSLEQNKAKLEFEQAKLELQRTRLAFQQTKKEIAQTDRAGLLTYKGILDEQIKSINDQLRATDNILNPTESAELKKELTDLQQQAGEVNRTILEKMKLPTTGAPPAKAAPAAKSVTDIQSSIPLNPPVSMEELKNNPSKYANTNLANWSDIVKGGSKVVMDPRTGVWKTLSAEDAAVAISRGGVEVPPPASVTQKTTSAQPKPQQMQGEFLK